MRRSLRVLIVDDSAVFLDRASRFLAAEPGLEVVGQALSGAEALTALERVAPDLVLMDVAMPGMSGLEATARIRARGPAPKIVVLTLHDDPTYRSEAAAAGADAFVHKEHFGRELLPLVQRLFDETPPL